MSKNKNYYLSRGNEDGRERGGAAELARARQKLDFLKKRKIAKYFRKFHKFGRVLSSKLFQNTRIPKPFIVQKLFHIFKKINEKFKG